MDTDKFAVSIGSQFQHFAVEICGGEQLAQSRQLVYSIPHNSEEFLTGSWCINMPRAVKVAELNLNRDMARRRPTQSSSKVGKESSENREVNPFHYLKR